MSRSIAAIFAVVALCWCAALFAAEQATTVVYLRNSAVSLTAPKDWLIDEESGRPRIQALFYPASAAGGEAEAVIYINTLSRNSEPNLDALIADDLAHDREESPKLQVREGEPVRLSDGASARIRHLSGDKWGNFESLAYIDTSSDYLAIILTCKNEAAWKGAQAAFFEVLKSYRVVSPDAAK